MLKLVTGQPGAGKTSNELWPFLHDKAYKGRPKFCTPIKGFEAAKHGVTEIEDLKGWRELPEGAVVFVDEVQDYLGARAGKEVPDWIREFARHRHYGMDFIFTTQSPMFLDPFVRKLCQQHVHYHRPWNMRRSSKRTWESVQGDPESNNAKKLSQAAVVTANPKVFDLYTSTVLDTHKPRPPWKLIIVASLSVAALLGGAVLALVMLGDVSDKAESNAAAAIENLPGAAPSVEIPSVSSIGSSVSAIGSQETVWTAESVQPRVKGLAWTAPVYDHLTKPTDFPRVAGCIKFKSKPCQCFTQQGTPVVVPEEACLMNVKEGSFDPWFSSRRREQPVQERQQVAEAPRQSSVVPVTIIPDSSRSPRTL
ncbi:zonular occludens toxin domain-containing protein [Pseudomonas aeruginosa]|nr:transposase [Pseudomonas aeruginosa]